MELLFKQTFLSNSFPYHIITIKQLICSVKNVLNTIWKIIITSLIVKNMTFVFKSCGVSVKI